MLARFSRFLGGGALLVAGAASSAWLSADVPDRSEAAQKAAVTAIADRAIAEMQMHYPDGAPTLVRRDAHAKAHGCARAKFTVAPDIAADLRIGSFAGPGKEYRPGRVSRTVPSPLAMIGAGTAAAWP